MLSWRLKWPGDDLWSQKMTFPAWCKYRTCIILAMNRCFAWTCAVSRMNSWRSHLLWRCRYSWSHPSPEGRRPSKIQMCCRAMSQLPRELIKNEAWTHHTRLQILILVTEEKPLGQCDIILEPSKNQDMHIRSGSEATLTATTAGSRIKSNNNTNNN